jgi:hypothetical protein
MAILNYPKTSGNSRWKMIFVVAISTSSLSMRPKSPVFGEQSFQLQMLPCWVLFAYCNPKYQFLASLTPPEYFSAEKVYSKIKKAP